MFLNKSLPKFLLKNLSPSHPYKIPYPSYFELLNLLHRYFPSKHLPSSLEPSPTLPEFLLPYVNHRVLKGIEEIIENLSDCLFNFSKRDDDCQEFVNETSLSHLNTPIYEFLEKKLGTNCEIVMTCALMEEENIYLVKELIKGYYNRENIFKIEGIFNDVKIIDKWSKVAFFKNLKYANAVRLFEKKEMESIWRNIQTIKNKQTEKISSQNEVKEALYLIKTEFLIAELLSINLTEKKLMDLVSNLIKERSQLPKILNEFECYSIFSEHNFLPFYNSKELLKIFQTQYEKLNNREKIKLMAMFGNKQNELDLIFLQDFDSVIETTDFKEVCQLARIFSNDQGLTDFLISQELNEENINDLTKNYISIAPAVRKHLEHEIIRIAQRKKSFYNFEAETLYRLGGANGLRFSPWLTSKLEDFKKEKEIEMTPNMQIFIENITKKEKKSFYNYLRM